MLNALKNATNYTRTENGAIAHKTTKSSIVDMFSTMCAMRSRSERDIITMFNKAFAEDPLIALKCIFYARDVRGGQGERRLFRIIIKYLAEFKPEIMKKNINIIPEFGRWDDLLELLDTPCEKTVIDLIKEQLNIDMRSKTPSLLAKWMPSENASSPATKRNALKLIQMLEMSPKFYRKTLSKLRKQINIIEIKLTTKNYPEINYSEVPSCASKKYMKAFWRNDEDRYREFIEAVTEGKTVDGKEVKMNTKTLYPYEIIRGFLKSASNIKENLSLEAMWKNLPDYVEGRTQNALAVVDISGSMSSNDWFPMSVAMSLGIYFGERNKGRFANHFITFSERPKLVEIKGTDIATKVKDILKYEEVASTNIKAVFDLLLQVAVSENLTQEELPEKLFICSDMEFDQATEGINSDTKRLFDYIQKSWDNAGYKFPKLIFWNVDARNESFPMTIDDAGVQFVSGCSPVIFKNLLQDKMMSPIELVLDVVNTERYSVVAI